MERVRHRHGIEKDLQIDLPADKRQRSITVEGLSLLVKCVIINRSADAVVACQA